MASEHSTATTSKTLRPSEIEVQPQKNVKNSPMSPLSWRNANRPVLGSRHNTTKSVDMEDYFVGPRDMSKHSKWPFFLRMHGSVLPKMILPLSIVAAWSTLITAISQFVYPLTVNNLLLTVLGFVVGLAISFRTSSAYERYTEGRKYWSQLTLVGQNLARTIWIHATERDDEVEGKEDLLAKISAMNLIIAFASSVKHKLRFEPGIDYGDLRQRIEHLETFAKAAEGHIPEERQYSKMKHVGEFLGVSWAESNPRKRVKNSKKPLGNLPLEILNHLSSYIHYCINNGTLSHGLYQNQCITSIVSLNEVFVGLERVLQTPLPVAYSIAISQITWVYVMLLPFQLWDNLRWITIPGCIFAAYIILGIAAIGREIENPFGMDVNDLPLEAYCEELETDIITITSQPPPDPKQFMHNELSMPLWPLSQTHFDGWQKRSKQDIRDALMTKSKADLVVRKSINPPRMSESHEKHHGALQQEA